MYPLWTDIHCAIALCVFVFGIIQLTFKNSGPLNHCIAIAVLSLAWVLFYLWAIEIDLLDILHIFSDTDMPMSILAAIGVYLTFTTVLGERENPPDHYAKHFIVPIVFFAAVICKNIIEIIFASRLPAEHIHYYGEIITDVVFFGYILAAVIEALFTREKNQIPFPGHFAAVFSFLCLLLILAVLFICADAFGMTTTTNNATSLCGILVIIYSIVSFRFPEYTQRVIKTTNGKFKHTTGLQNSEGMRLMESIDALMEKKQLYRNPELSLDDVGAELRIPAATVSQLINTMRRINFKTYLNRYRIGEICRKLIVKKDTPILEIAFANGFNSKSAFNAAFLEITGMTPSQYRKASKS